MNFKGSHRENLLSIYQAALAAVNGKRCVEHYLRENPFYGEVYVLAIGKAASAMTEGAFEVLGTQIKAALVITKQGCLDRALIKSLNKNRDKNLSNVETIEASHPIPDQSSLVAGKKLLDFVSSLPTDAKLLCLISGGTSSLVEVLPEPVSLAKLTALNEWLLQSGLAIDAINAIRKRVSCIKGGRLARKFSGQAIKLLLISDVQGDSPSQIGSGLFSPPKPADFKNNKIEYPEEFNFLIESSAELPAYDDPCFDRVEFAVVATIGMAIDAAQRCAASMGYSVEIHREYLTGDAIAAGKTIASEIKKSPGKLHLWGGECTVKLPENYGVGGRCQSLALSAAIALDKQAHWCLLAAGTDGSDGTKDIAGACVDNGTISRAQKAVAGYEDAKDYLQRADAGTYLQMANDLINTGATGTNVTDLVIGYMEEL
jgi:hydroxypyruvate reductase